MATVPTFGDYYCCSVTKSCTTLCNAMDCSKPGFPVLHYHKLMSVGSMMLSNHLILCHPSSPPALNLSQHQGLFQWVSSSHQVVKVLELQLQHQSFQWIFRTDFLYNWLIWSPCSPRDSQESSPTPQFKSISSSGTQLSLLSISHIHTWLLEKA